ncbi:uncharacterized protein LOC131876625 [Cryptomeria japonica]|uniref:uncharacterized protein LOC131876625 n=1 Tax=Cryptomeria japonica TaxID=3369 RepID=UPI0027D9FE9F|nr:uncharacterized protein LOC131876625 [Cryptomeria japonica]
MRVYGVMDFIMGLPKAQGRDSIYVAVDQLTKYAHFFPITTTYSVAQVAALFFRETEIVSKWVEAYLQNYISRQQKAWVRWLLLCEYCYNSTHHMTIQMTPFRALYGYDAPIFLDLLMSDCRVPSVDACYRRTRISLELFIRTLKKAKNQQKQYADQRRVERSFEIEDMVIIKRVGEVDYELDLPVDSKVHNVFHVSHLKKALGQHIAPSSNLPPLDDEGKLILVPELVIETRERHLRRRVIREILVKWRDMPIEDAT